MRESRLSGSVEGVMSDHDSYSDCRVRGLSRVVSLSCFLLVLHSLVMSVPCGRGATARSTACLWAWRRVWLCPDLGERQLDLAACATATRRAPSLGSSCS